MSTATSFQTRGRRNGFPLCLTNVDVSGFDNWITMGGKSSGSASQSEINASLINCMNLFWNTSKGRSNSSGLVSTNDPTSPINVSFDEVDFDHTISIEPRKRCSSQITGLAFTESINSSGDSVDCTVNLQFSAVRMYDGSTSNSSNFVGYGFSGLMSGSQSSQHSEGFLGTTVNINVSSYLNGEDDSGTVVNPDGSGEVTYFDKKVHTFNTQGVSFKVFNQINVSTIGLGTGLSPNFTSQASKASVTVTGTDSGVDYTAESEINIENLFLHTY